MTPPPFLLSLWILGWCASRLWCAAPGGEAARYYRADAVISVLSVRIIQRTGVGSGFASLASAVSPEGRTLTLRFAAGSWPERAHGLNRLGYIEEYMEERESAPARSGYFGVMTSSDEHSLSDARRALAAKNAGGVTYSAIRGVVEPEGYRSAKVRFRSEEGYSWSRWPDLLPEARHAIDNLFDARQIPAAPATAGATSPAPLLCTLWQAILSSQNAASRRFVWSGQEYVLRTERSPDPEAGRRLARAAVTAHPNRVVRLDGWARNPRTGRQSRFRIWYDEAEEAPLPLRIEYRPRAFLQLVFEADPRLAGPAPLTASAAPRKPSAGE